MSIAALSSFLPAPPMARPAPVASACAQAAATACGRLGRAAAARPALPPSPPPRPLALAARRGHVPRRLPVPSASGGAGPPPAASGGGAGPADGQKALRYQLLFKIVLKLSEAPGPEPLAAFLAKNPEAASVPFLWWVSELEAAAAEPREKAALGALCGRLLAAREEQDEARMDDLYASTLQRISGGDAAAEGLVLGDPAAYSSALARTLTGADPSAMGYEDPLLDVILAAAPPAALTVAGVKQARGRRSPPRRARRRQC
jgi:hypothetical protein